jgi:hypothetical protein
VRSLKIVAPLYLMLAMFGSSVHAQPVAPLTIGGTVSLEVGPTFIRSADEACNVAGVSVYYGSVEFYVSTDGDYSLRTTDNATIGHNASPFLAVYQSPFDPGLPAVNCLAADEHGALEADDEASLTIPLTAGTHYTAIITTSQAMAIGQITWLGSGPGDMHYVAPMAPVDTASVDSRRLTVARIETSTLSPDPEVCPSGGVRIHAGIDANANGHLDDDEVSADEVICSGANGLVNTKPLDPSPDECPTGGVQIESGTDLDGNGVLEGTEVTSSRRACNAVQTLTRSTTLEPAKDECAFGGVKVDSGLDLNGDDTLDDDEVKASSNVCNGSGLAVRSMKLSAGSDDCRTGGVALETGIDTDGDGKLDASEVLNREVVCKPAQLLFETETLAAKDQACPRGGLLLKSGLDDGDPGGTPGDGQLQLEEVDVDRALCIAPINLQIGSKDGTCSTMPGQRRSGELLWLVATGSFVLIVRRRRRAPAGRAPTRCGR